MELEQTLLAAHQAALFQEQSRRERLEAELQQALADERAERDVLKAQVEQVLAEGMRLGQMLEESEAETTRLNALVDASAKTREQLEAEHAMERLRVQQTLVDEHQHALQQREQDARQRIDELKQMLQATLGESQRLEMLIEAGQADRRKLVADHDAARTVAERALTAAAEQSDRIAQALAAQRAELQISEDQTRRLEPLAAAGRLALEVSKELQDVLASLDDRARRLLAGAAGAAAQPADRDMIEAVRREAVRAASLARQVVQAHDGKSAGGGRTQVASDSPLTPVETKRSL
jgi:chromosome segregation ATPase